MAKKQKHRRVTVVFDRGHAWLYNCIWKIAKKKIECKLPTSMGDELLRLAKNGLLNSMADSETDKKILKDVKCSLPKS